MGVGYKMLDEWRNGRTSIPFTVEEEKWLLELLFLKCRLYHAWGCQGWSGDHSWLSWVKVQLALGTDGGVRESEQPDLWPQWEARGFYYLSEQDYFLPAQSKQELLLREGDPTWWEREVYLVHCCIQSITKCLAPGDL